MKNLILVGLALVNVWLSVALIQTRHQVKFLTNEYEAHDGMLEQLGDAVTSLESKGGK